MRLHGASVLYRDGLNHCPPFYLSRSLVSFGLVELMNRGSPRKRSFEASKLHRETIIDRDNDS